MTIHIKSQHQKGTFGDSSYLSEPSNSNYGRRGRNNTEGEELPEVQPTAYQQFHVARQQNITNFYFTEDFQDPKFYTDMVHRIRTAQPQDIIYLHFNTPGGRLDTGIQIINAIADSAARIVGVLDSKAYSLGTLILLACDEFVIHENCLFMIHNFSGGTYGKGNEQQAELNATLRWFGKIATKYYYPFLSREEIQKVLQGQDFWMDSEEVTKRLKNMVRIREEEANTPKTRAKRKKETAVAAVIEEEQESNADVEQAAKDALPKRKRKSAGLKNDLLNPKETVELS